MPDPILGPLRLYGASRDVAARGPSPPLPLTTEGGSSLTSFACSLANQETLRPSPLPPEAGEPLSLQWFLHLEQVRHHRQGRWLPRLLEFGKHQGEKLLGLGSGLGSDLVRYAAAGAEVVAACSSAEQLALIRRNFDLRGLPGVFLHAPARTLPLESASIDVACLTGLLHEPDDPAPIVEEVYRVLKPGGKILAVVPARYDIIYWSRISLIGSRADEPVAPCPAGSDLLQVGARRFRSREVRQLFARFPEHQIWKRHLRRAEVPHLWRWVPLSLMERLVGRLLVFKGFKPVSAARFDQAVA